MSDSSIPRFIVKYDDFNQVEADKLRTYLLDKSDGVKHHFTLCFHFFTQKNRLTQLLSNELAEFDLKESGKTLRLHRGKSNSSTSLGYVKEYSLENDLYSDVKQIAEKAKFLGYELFAIEPEIG